MLRQFGNVQNPEANMQALLIFVGGILLGLPSGDAQPGLRLCGCQPDIPVCASNGKTYPSQCDMSCDFNNPNLVVIYHGPCTSYIPVSPTPSPYAPTQPIPYTPPEPSPYTPTQPIPYTPPEPSPYAPTQPIPYTPPEPSPYAPTQPIPYTPPEPSPYAPTQPIPYTPPQPSPYAPAQPIAYTPSQTSPYALIPRIPYTNVPLRSNPLKNVLLK